LNAETNLVAEVNYVGLVLGNDNIGDGAFENVEFGRGASPGSVHSLNSLIDYGSSSSEGSSVNGDDIVTELNLGKWVADELNVIQSELFEVIRSQNMIGVENWLSVNLDGGIEFVEPNGDTPLLVAVGLENFDIVRGLVKAGADLQVFNNMGLSVLDLGLPRHQLFLTEARDGLELIDELIENGLSGSDPNVSLVLPGSSSLCSSTCSVNSSESAITSIDSSSI